jgi:phosphatidylglycerophosphatase A
METPKVTVTSKMNIPPIPKSIWQNPLHFIAFGFGTGAIPIAPGTFGTLLAIPFYLFLQLLNPTQYIAMVGLLTVISIFICDRVSKDIQVHDHPGMNLDEFIGFFITMIYVPSSWYTILLGFLLFRLFDIWKPFPIRWVDRKVSGGFGVIFDDVLAGIFACVVLHLLIWN